MLPSDTLSKSFPQRQRLNALYRRRRRTVANAETTSREQGSTLNENPSLCIREKSKEKERTEETKKVAIAEKNSQENKRRETRCKKKTIGPDNPTFSQLHQTQERTIGGWRVTIRWWQLVGSSLRVEVCWWQLVQVSIAWWQWFGSNWLVAVCWWQLVDENWFTTIGW